MERKKSNISFEGKGKVSIEYFKDCLVKKGEEFLASKIKRIVIEDGEDFIDESKIPVIGSILQKGGVIDCKLKATKFFLFGGKNGGVEARNIYLSGEHDSVKIKGNLIARNALIKGASEIDGDATYHNSQLVDSQKILGNLTLNDSASIAQNSIVHVLGDTTFNNTSFNSGTLNIDKNLIFNGNGRTFKKDSVTTVLGDATGDSFASEGTVSINGNLQTSYFSSYPNGFITVKGNLNTTDMGSSTINPNSRVEVKGIASFSNNLENSGSLIADKLTVAGKSWTKFKLGSVTEVTKDLVLNGKMISESGAELHAKTLDITSDSAELQYGSTTKIKGNITLAGKTRSNGYLGGTANLIMKDSASLGAKSITIIEGSATLYNQSKNYGNLTITKSLDLFGDGNSGIAPSLESGVTTVKFGNVSLNRHSKNKATLDVLKGNFSMTDFSSLEAGSKTNVNLGKGSLSSNSSNSGVLIIGSDLTLTEFAMLNPGSTTNVIGPTYFSANVLITPGTLNTPQTIPIDKARVVTTKPRKAINYNPKSGLKI